MNQTEKGKIEIQCPPLFISKFRAYSIYLDEMKVGRIKEGKTATISTTPGIHTIWLRIDWVRSNRKQVSIEANKTVRLIIERNQMEGWEYWGMLIVVGLLIAVGATFGILFGAIFIGIAGAVYAQYALRPKLKEL